MFSQVSCRHLSALKIPCFAVRAPNMIRSHKRIDDHVGTFRHGPKFQYYQGYMHIPSQ